MTDHPRWSTFSECVIVIVIVIVIVGRGLELLVFFQEELRSAGVSDAVSFIPSTK